MRTAWLLAATVCLATAVVEEKDRPVARVIALLRNIQNELQAEKAKDEELFAKLECWCRVNKKNKEGAVGEANRRINQQEATIQEAAASKATAEVQAKNLKEDIAEMEQELKERDEMKRGESGEAAGKQKDLLESIQQLKNAVKVLTRNLGGKKAFLQARMVIRHLLWKWGDIVSKEPREQLSSLLQAPGAYSSYASRADGIVGILSQMLDDMEQQLADTKGGEDDNMKKYRQWKEAKTEELKAAQANLDQTKANLAASAELLMNTKKDHDDTRAALDADQKFLMDLKLRCQASDNEWAERQKVRNDEMLAISETIKILSDDDAHDLFNKSLNRESVTPAPPAFIQTSKRSTADRVAAQLKRFAQKTGNTQLMLLASEVQLKVFTKVIDAMHKMTKDLTAENKEDRKMKEWCGTAIFETKKTTTEANRKREDLETTISQLTENIERLAREIAEHTTNIQENNKQMKIAGEQRDAENAEFKQMVIDQTNTRSVLNKAMKRMQRFYKEKSLVQKDDMGAMEPGAQVEAMPEGFNEYNKNAGATGVMSILQKIIDDSQKAEDEDTATENEAQQAYEEFVKTMNESNEAESNSILDKQGQTADAEQAKADADNDLAATMTELENLAAKTAELHKQCDFLLKNFDIRVQARLDTIKALQNAIGALKGADMQTL